MGKVLSVFANGFVGTIARNRDDVVVALANKSGEAIPFGVAVALDESKTGVVRFNGSTHTGADFVGVTVRAPQKTPETYGSSVGDYAANEMVDVLVRGHIVANVAAGSAKLGVPVAIRTSDNAFAIGSGDGYVALPNVRISASTDASRNAELVLTERNVL